MYASNPTTTRIPAFTTMIFQRMADPLSLARTEALQKAFDRARSP
jgi:hypothetical protein